MSLLKRLNEQRRQGTLFKYVFTILRRRIRERIYYGNLFAFANHDRMLTKKVNRLFEPINANHIAYSNYYLDKRIQLTPKSIVYSFGILNDVGFDLAISHKHHCAVFMFDPTPLTQQFMKQHADKPLLRYFAEGVWTEDTTLTFFQPALGGSASAFGNAAKGATSFAATCKTVQTIMRENDHPYIDVLKMDIEGAALPILEQLFQQQIYPQQIVAEFERPENDVEAMITFFYKILSLKKQAQNHGYQVYSVPRDKSKYFSIELLFVRLPDALKN